MTICLKLTPHEQDVRDAFDKQYQQSTPSIYTEEPILWLSKGLSKFLH